MKNKNINAIFLSILIIFSFSINYIYGNIGIFPIDSFAFFDTGFSILQGKHPFKDIWVTTGPLVDYMQAFFFKIFGYNWSSYVIHASFLNLFIALSSYLFFLKNKISFFFSFFYAISISILCYPVMATPFAYHHSYIFSLISIFLLCLGLKYENKKVWFFLPFSMLISFLCMQTPSAYINILILIIVFIYSLKNFKNKCLLSFLYGCLFSLIFLISYFLIFKIPIINFIEQYILFPISIGSSRIADGEGAFVTLHEKLTFRGIIGHFKFIHLAIIVLIISFLSKKNKKGQILFTDYLISIFIISSSYLYIFNQLLTANQTFIFSLIPLITGFAHINLKNKLDNKYLNIFIIIFISFVTIKYHQVYNSKRKFIDLQNVNLSKAINANQISPKFKKLKWITPDFSENPKIEINLIKKTIEILKNDERKKMVITDYQFLSLVLNEDLNIPNRWYTHDGNSYPLKKHKLYRSYQDFLNKKIKKEEIKVIYIVDSKPKGGIKFKNIQEYLTDNCFNSKDIVEDIISSHEVISCK
jgi:hypothetical protein